MAREESGGIVTRFAVVNARTGWIVGNGQTYEIEANADIAAKAFSIENPNHEYAVAAVDYATV